MLGPMATVTLPGVAGEDWAPAAPPAPADGRLRRVVRGRPDDRTTSTISVVPVATTSVARVALVRAGMSTPRHKHLSPTPLFVKLVFSQALRDTSFEMSARHRA